MSEELSGKVAVITGGAAGIGAATARQFLAEGARVVIADIDRDRGNALAAECGPDLTFTYTDVSQRSDVEELVRVAVDTYGSLDIMFNNAGISGQMRPDLLEDDFADFDQVIRVDLLGVMLGTQIAARYLRHHGGGSIINTTSIGGIQAGSTMMCYRAAKAGVIHFSKSAAIELGHHKIRVNCIAPGGIPTDLLSAATGDPEGVDGITAALRGLMRDDRPLDVTADSSDIAHAAVYLGSDRSRYVTGTVLTVDGGMTAGHPRNYFRTLLAESTN